MVDNEEFESVEEDGELEDFMQVLDD